MDEFEISTYVYLSVIILFIVYILIRMVLQTYFNMKMNYINQVIEKAKELTKHGKEK